MVEPGGCKAHPDERLANPCGRDEDYTLPQKIGVAMTVCVRSAQISAILTSSWQVISELETMKK